MPRSASRQSGSQRARTSKKAGNISTAWGGFQSEGAAGALSLAYFCGIGCYGLHSWWAKPLDQAAPTLPEA